jgi:hypothetical protein
MGLDVDTAQAEGLGYETKSNLRAEGPPHTIEESAPAKSFPI